MDRSFAAVAAIAGAAIASIVAQKLLQRAPPPPSLGVAGDNTQRQWLVVVRHGDRHDYATPAWKEKIKAMGGRPRDPPLSTLGHRQATRFGRAAAAALRARGGSVRVRTSPYLRCIQTAMPLCDALDLPLTLEPGVAEVSHKRTNVAPYAERFAYFPRLVEGEPDPMSDEESWPLGYMERIAAFGEKLTRELDARLATEATSTLVLTSHAASVGLVAWMLGDELTPELKMAPAGCYVLARDAADEPWALLRAGDANAPYNGENAATTFPWGYRPEYLAAWETAHGARFPRP